MRRNPWQFVFVGVVGFASFVCLSVPARADEPAPPGAAGGILALTSNEPETLGGDPKKSGGKLLVRELLRQAVLIAGRDQLGLATRDMALREAMAARWTKVLEAQTAERIGKSARLRLSAGANDQKKVIFDREIPLPAEADAPFDYLALSAAAEAWSRTELVDALREAGLTGRANALSPDVKPSTATLQRIDQMNFFSQFAALRDLHELQRTGGESAETLGALVRAYANLGQLTSFHWNASHKVFKARSLLYAQRLMQLDKQSPWAYRHRAYALAMAGLHAAALDDLKAVGTTKTGDAKPKAETTWVPMIKAYCRYDVKALTEIKPGEDQQELLALLSYMAIESCGCERYVITRGNAALEVIPECYRVCDSMSRYMLVTNLNRATMLGPLVLQNTLAIRLQDMPQLPRSVSELVAAQEAIDVDDRLELAWAASAQRQAIIKGLLAAGSAEKDRQEPSWEQVGRALEDATFAQVFERLDFFFGGIAWERGTFLNQVDYALEAVGSHPNLSMIKAVSINPITQFKEIHEIALNLKVVDADTSMMPFIDLTTKGHPQNKSFKNPLWPVICRHADDIAQEAELIASRTKTAADAHRVLKISPRSPQGVALAIENDPKYAASRLQGWKDEYADHPGVQRALANQFWTNKEFADALDCMEKYVNLSPDQSGFTRLAEMLWDQKKFEKWHLTLEGALAQQDFAGAHDQANVKLARYHLERKELDKAVAYADAAAAKQVNYGLQCAAECHEALGEWDKAEELMRTLSKVYSWQGLDWYFWCRRTGHGEIDKAKFFAQAAAKTMLANNVDYELNTAGVFYLLTGDKESARVAFQKAFNVSTSIFSALQLSLLGDVKGDKLLRDSPLLRIKYKELVSVKPPPGIQEQLGFIKWLTKVYTQPADAEPDLAALEPLLKGGEAKDQAMLACLIGQYFLNHEKPELARKYFKLSVEAAAGRRDWYLVPASIFLKELPKEADEEKK